MFPVLLDSWGVLVYIWGIRVLLLFLASFLQELALLHGWIEHALLPPDYMDLSGIFINSSARVCTILQTKNAARSGQRDTDLSNQRRKGEERRWEGCLLLRYWQFGAHQTDSSICPRLSSSTSLHDLCLLKTAHADTHTDLTVITCWRLVYILNYKSIKAAIQCANI